MDISMLEGLLKSTMATQTQGEVPPANVNMHDQKYFESLLINPSALPEVLMQAQATMNRMAVGVELCAKVAGGMAQGINKLTSMQ